MLLLTAFTLISLSLEAQESSMRITGKVIDLSGEPLIGVTIQENAFQVEHYMEDTVAEREIDYYYVRVRQKNQQWAWSSPIWVEKR